MNRNLNFFSGNSASNPQLAHIMMRCVASKGPMPVEELRRHVQPEGLIDGGSAAWDATLDVLGGLGVLSVDEQVELLVNFNVPADGSIRPHDFRVAFGRQLVTHSRYAINQKSDPSDLAQSLLWLSLLSGSEVFHAHAEAQRDFFSKGFDKDMISNQTQWRPFIRWAASLGVLKDFGHGLCVDLAGVMRAALMDTPLEISVQALLASLASLTPLRDDPTLGEWFETKGGLAQQPGLTGAVSLALLRLEHGGEIAMPPHDDAGGARALYGGNRTVNKVVKVVADEL